MAELGTIQHTDVNAGTRPVDRTNEVRAIHQGASAVKTAVDASIVAGYTGDLQDAITETAQGFAQPVQDVEADQQWEPGSKEARIQAKVDKLSAQIQQGRSSEVDAAQNKMQTIMADAQINYPWLYDQLQRRTGQVMAASVELDKMGARDAVRTATSSAALKEYQAFEEYSHKAMKDGGLGIPTWISPSDPEFLPLYTQRQGLIDMENQLAYQVGLATATKGLRSHDVYSTVSQVFVGQYNGIQSAYRDAFEDSGLIDTLYTLSSEENPDPAILEEARTGVNAALISLELSKQQMADLWTNNIELNLRDQPKFADLKLMYEDGVKEIDSIIAMVRDVEDRLPTAAQFIEERALLRGFHYGEQNVTEPQRAILDWFTTPHGSIIKEIAKDSNTELGLILQADMGEWGSNTLMGIMSPSVFSPSPTSGGVSALAAATGGGTFNVDPNMSPEAVQRQIQQRFKSSNTPFLIATPDQVYEADAALQNADQSFAIWGTYLSNFDNEAAPAVAAETMRRLNLSFAAFNSHAEGYEEVEQVMLKGLASEQTSTLLERTSGSYQGERMAFGESSQEWYLRTRPDKRREKIQDLYQNAHVDSEPLWELAGVNYDKRPFSLEFIVDDKLVAQMAREAFQQKSVLSAEGIPSSTTIAKERQRIYRQINQALVPIQNEVMQQINIERNLNSAIALNPEERLRGDSTLQYFLGQDGDYLTWAEIFRPVTNGPVNE